MAVDIYLELAGTKTGPVKGEAMLQEKDGPLAGKTNLIDVTKVTFGATSPEDVATKQASGKVQLSDVDFDTPVSTATSAMMSMIMNNESLKTCTFYFRKAGNVGKTYVFMKLSLTKSRITSLIQESAQEKSTLAVKIGYTELAFDYYMQKQDGKLDSAPHSASYSGDTGNE